MSETHAKLSRRTLFAGVGAAGTVATVATLVPSVSTTLQEKLQPPKPEKGGGYNVSEHVKRYYKSTLV